MSPEAQRIAIAEACGWKFDVKGIPTDERGTEWNILKMSAVPEYLHDLNAMYWAEDYIPKDKRYKYPTILAGVVLGTNFEEAYEVNWRQGNLNAVLHATAAQRAEAFLKTLNLWK